MKTALEFIKEIDEDGQEWSDDTEVLARYFNDYAKLYHEDKTRLLNEELQSLRDELRQIHEDEAGKDIRQKSKGIVL